MLLGREVKKLKAKCSLDESWRAGLLLASVEKGFAEP